MKLPIIIGVITLVTATTSFAAEPFPETQKVDGVVWHYFAKDAASIMCNPKQAEGSLYDTVFNVAYTPDDSIFTYHQPNMYTYSCVKTVMNNPNYIKASNGYAYCGGSMDKCAPTLA